MIGSSLAILLELTFSPGLLAARRKQRKKREREGEILGNGALSSLIPLPSSFFWPSWPVSERHANGDGLGVCTAGLVGFSAFVYYMKEFMSRM